MSSAFTDVLLVAGLALSSVGCLNGDRGPPDADRDASEWIGPTSSVDMLVVVDNREGGAAASTNGSVASLGPRVASALHAGWSTQTGRMVRAESIHVAIVSGDMGVGPVTDAGRGCLPGPGDDALFLGAGGPVSSGNVALPPDGVFVLDDTVDPLMFAPALAAAGFLQVHGCIRQQPLEAALKALAPAPAPDGLSSVSWTRAGYRPPIFFGGTPGHGGPGGPSESFLRADSVLVVLIATPFDDCSTAHPEIFSMADPRYDAANVLCPHDPDQRHDVQRYVDGLLGLRASGARIVLGAIVAVPTEVEQRPPSEILAHPEMQERPDPTVQGRLLPSCVGTTGLGFPPRRIVAMADGLARDGASIVMISSCELAAQHEIDFQERVIEAIAEAMAGSS